MKTEFITLTELWRDGDYNRVGERVNDLPPKAIAEFCSYFAKYVGTRDLSILYKFM